MNQGERSPTPVAAMPQNDIPFAADPADIKNGKHAAWYTDLIRDSYRQASTQTTDRMCEKIGEQMIFIITGWGNPSWEGELEMHTRVLWQLFYDTALFCNDKYSRNRLVVELMHIKGMGRLARSEFIGDVPLPFPHRPETRLSPPTSDGHLFAEMPFFAHDMTRLWLRDMHRGTLNRQERRNLHWFLATASALGVDQRLCGIGISVLHIVYEVAGLKREAFKRMEEATGETAGPSGQQGASSTARPRESILEMEEIALLWLHKNGDRFRRLAEEDFADLPSRVGPPVGPLGPLAKAAGVPDNGGFSLERLHFWYYGAASLGEMEASRKARALMELGPQNHWHSALD